MIDRRGTGVLGGLLRVAMSVGAAGTVLIGCGSGGGGAACPKGVVRYVGQGLTLLVPDGVNPDTGMTGDVSRVHASGGVVFSFEGHEVQVWRSGERPSGAESAAVAIKPAGVGSQWLWVQSDLPEVNECILDSVVYDRMLDEADE